MVKESNNVFKGLFIKYVPSLNLVIKNKDATLLASSLEYRFSRYRDGFYKFMEPCDHRDYRSGDSWTEELFISRKSFNRAFERIGIRYKSKSAFYREKDPFQGKMYASYYDRTQYKTYYFRNHDFVENILKKIIKISPNADKKKVGTKPSEKKGRSGTAHSTVPFLYKQNNTSSVLRGSKPKIKELDLEMEKKTDEMKNIWIEEIGEGGIPKSLKPFVRRIHQAFCDFFEKSLDKWRYYCRKIASSKFLMGEKTNFRAWISWVIKGEVFERIMAGDFDIGDRIPQKVQAENDRKRLELERDKAKEAQIEREARTKETARRKAIKDYLKEKPENELEEIKKSYRNDLLSGISEFSKSFKTIADEMRTKGWRGMFVETTFHEWVGEMLLNSENTT